MTPTTKACLVLAAAGLDLGKLPPGAGAEDAIRASEAPESDPGIGNSVASRIRSLNSTGFAEKEWERASKAGFLLINAFEGTYPRLLKQISDPPLALYAMGDSSVASRPSVAVVGSRNATAYGLSVAAGLASQLAFKGLCVVSGFARGVDAAAHREAVRAGGCTTGVLGCGLDVDYPKGHGQLRDEVLRKGCLLSELPIGTNPSKFTFPRRNRIISGLSFGVVVVEAAERSGALITARQAMEQGREVFAVPGNVFSHSSRGPHRLLRDGAKLTESVEDVLEEIANVFKPEEGGKGPEPVGGTVEQAVMAVLKTEPTHIDEIGRTAGMTISQLSAVLSLLEIKGCVRQSAGKYFSRI